MYRLCYTSARREPVFLYPHLSQSPHPVRVRLDTQLSVPANISCFQVSGGDEILSSPHPPHDSLKGRTTASGWPPKGDPNVMFFKNDHPSVCLRAFHRRNLMGGEVAVEVWPAVVTTNIPGQTITKEVGFGFFEVIFHM